ncbi:hypothetical protein pneo_cds_448 [Pandoravirus neocaledonia]|uniref:Uncharacterized protein n=1 Tax=Pandoravirus neocaledonia TaxID=2107708 RepID=A0A2U7UCG8_9VIRU|nr:hypothetical protein pneo_cds_448 [Pandoravirus neocaledonia]AVK76055.1 hypothetical protein pneo_cds_448 [Pandoravirus neocaledonia]
MMVRAARFGHCRALAVLHDRGRCRCTGRLGAAALQGDHAHVLDWLNRVKCSGALGPVTPSVEQALRSGSWRTLKWIGQRVGRKARALRPTSSEEAMVEAASGNFVLCLAAAQKYDLGRCTKRVVVAAVTSHARQAIKWILHAVDREVWCGPWLGGAAAVSADMDTVERLLRLPEAHIIFRRESASIALDRGRVAVASLIYRARVAPLDRAHIWAACAALECRWHERDVHGALDGMNDVTILDDMVEGYRSVLALSPNANAAGGLFGTISGDGGVPTWWGPRVPRAVLAYDPLTDCQPTVLAGQLARG